MFEPDKGSKYVYVHELYTVPYIHGLQWFLPRCMGQPITNIPKLSHSFTLENQTTNYSSICQKHDIVTHCSTSPHLIHSAPITVIAYYP